jgi:hypothetical protein
MLLQNDKVQESTLMTESQQHIEKQSYPRPAKITESKKRKKSSGEAVQNLFQTWR